jgi:hypothetical protein
MNDFSNLKTNQVSEEAEFIINTLKYEIYSKLPRLTEDEKTKRQELINNKKNQDAQELNKFYNKIKFKYNLFIELKYIPNDLLHELYGYLITYEDEKFSLKNVYFFYSKFIKKTVEKTVEEVFDKSLEERLQQISSKALDNFDEFWVSAIFDCNTPESHTASINDIIKYNAEISSTTSLIITMELFYDRLINDLYTLITHKKKISRIIFKIDQKSFWMGNNVQPMIYFDDDEWDRDINRIINVLLNCLLEKDNLMCFSLFADEKCKVNLNGENISLLCKLLEKNKDCLEIMTISRFVIPEMGYRNFWEAVKNCFELKILILKGAKFSEKFFEEIREEYVNGRLLAKNNIYFRFSKRCMTNKRDDQ